jgi:hypothetical protein
MLVDRKVDLLSAFFGATAMQLVILRPPVVVPTGRVLTAVAVGVAVGTVVTFAADLSRMYSAPWDKRVPE